MRNVVIKFCTIFRVKDALRSGRTSAKTKNLQVQVLATIAAQLTQSVQKITDDVCTCKSTIYEF